MSQYVIAPDLALGPVELTVADLGRSLAFYGDVLGLRASAVGEGGARVVALDASGAPLLILHERPGARRRPPRSTGLYHVALLTPSRRELARTLARLASARYPLTGASDHLVSEALYLDDPDGNGLEIYADRPREAWPRAGREVRMTVDPLDVEGLLGEVDDQQWRGMAAGTTVGHVHLHVADLAATEAFYGALLGFELMQRFPGALFMAANGYHHHLGLNIWAGAGAPPPPPDAVGLRRFAVTLPGAVLEELTARISGAGVPAEVLPEGVLVRDPAQNAILLRGR